MCVLWIDDKGTPSNSFLGQTRTHTLEEDSCLGGHEGPTKHFKGPGVGGSGGWDLRCSAMTEAAPRAQVCDQCWVALGGAHARVLPVCARTCERLSRHRCESRGVFGVLVRLRLGAHVVSCCYSLCTERLCAKTGKQVT